MNRTQQKRKYLAQNFLTDRNLVARLAGKAGLRPGDTVIDIGAGRGIITAELARRCARVIAIEKDPVLAGRLRDRFRELENVEVIACDFLRYRIPVPAYKVVASIPYNVTADIVRRLLNSSLSEAHLIMQKQPAKKLAGTPHETMLSLHAKTRFRFEIVHELRRTDFHPVPDVDSVMLRITRRQDPVADEIAYHDFVRYGFGRYKRNLRLAFKNVFSYKSWKRISRELGFDINATPTELSFRQWVGLYEASRGK